MKKTFLTAIVLSTVLLFSCSKEDVNTVEEANLTQTVEVKSAKNQLPQLKFDKQNEGLYLGFVASETTQSRGYIYVNAGNDGKFTALIEMIDGVELKLQSNSNSLNDVYQFEGDNGSFTLDISNFDSATVTNVVLNNHDYKSMIAKKSTTRMPNAQTGIFHQTGRPGWNGTWNIIADGTLVNPNGAGGEGITNMMITKNGATFNETVFETFSFEPCGGPPVWIPTLGAGIGPIDGSQAWGQTTTIGAASIQWNLLYLSVGQEYADNACNPLESGNFTWTASNGNIKLGEIYVDVPTN